MNEVSTKNSAKGDKGNVPATKTAIGKESVATSSSAGSKTGSTKPPTLSEIQPLLVKNTCAACHNATKRQVGPSFTEISKRNYSVNKILSLIKNPQPQNWPGYSTEMPPMPQVPKADAQKIAVWIRSLSK